MTLIVRPHPLYLQELMTVCLECVGGFTECVIVRLVEQLLRCGVCVSCAIGVDIISCPAVLMTWTRLIDSNSCILTLSNVTHDTVSRVIVPVQTAFSLFKKKRWPGNEAWE